MTYESLSRWVQQAGTLYFVGIFLAVLVYALRPSKSAEFDKAARAPLDTEEHP